MRYYVTKSNIHLHKGAFTTYEQAKEFARAWLEENFDFAQFNEPTTSLGDRQVLESVVRKEKKGNYLNTRKIYIKCSYTVHYDGFGDVHRTKEMSVLITWYKEVEK
jgi:hypothetical protein